ncbi:MAG: hypothetical protein A2904_02060 [Candidatus Staskawiczbacteria bacterium RIFCSPLOWO2_01_FULL_33_9]|uniref:DUF8128 domain-containing protein n=1 Tax=Candidatus Staskawiczbacteria bacterium RIFCSPLOWO2_01_FULL_33_9 TaxID=1802211 RepID=A0A1G2IAG3_9BACT|nr:MAG: hypothetical protein A2904_02060 [Candidatus Staskawiczbacteria bacterium RIFCSPLOWO2_01_FULL_33_9]
MAFKLPAPLFWLEWVKKIVWDSFWWVFLMLFVLWVPFLRVWWWLFFPLFLSIQLKTLYLWWIDWDFTYAKTKWKMLEIIPPKEVLIPLKAMEDVFTTVWPIYDSANWRERWCEGELDNSPYWMSWEIASIEGQIHFYIRVMASHKTHVETSLYGHYPEIEIKEVSDYTKLVPQNIPNEEWDLYGEDWELYKTAGYPIKTYEKFFEPQGERISAEEKRIDPIASLLELLSKLGRGEHYWVQFITVPVLDQDEPTWRERAEKEITRIAKRPEKKETTLFEDLMYVFRQVTLGPEKEGSGEKATYKWMDSSKSEEGEREMVMTPGEREIVTEIENKTKKPVYRTAIRGVYVAKRENWKSSNRILSRSYFAHFSTQNLNRLSFSGKTRPKIHYIWRKRRVFLRARKMFKNSVLRFPSLFPDRKSVSAILSTEELATLFHFPMKITGLVAPTMSRIESKKGGPPPNLPIE